MTAPKKTTKKVTPKKKTTAKKTAKRVSRATKPKNTDIIVVSPVDPNSRIVVASEMADDQMIEAGLMGEVLPYFVYQFEQKGQTITGLTVKGVSEVVRRLNRDKKSGYNIRINPQYQKVEHNIDMDGVKGVQVSVYAENLLDGNSAWGIKFEAYKKTGRNGQYTNEFAVEKALSKAERNAKRKLIPETAATKMIEKLINEDPNSIKKLEAPAARPTIVKPLPPKPSSLEEVKDLVRRGVKAAKTVEIAMEFDRKTQASKDFDDAFKKEIRDTASLRVDELSK